MPNNYDISDNNNNVKESDVFKKKTRDTSKKKDISQTEAKSKNINTFTKKNIFKKSAEVDKNKGVDSLSLGMRNLGITAENNTDNKEFKTANDITTEKETTEDVIVNNSQANNFTVEDQVTNLNVTNSQNLNQKNSFDDRNHLNSGRIENNRNWQQRDRGERNYQTQEDEFIINTETVVNVKDLREKQFDELLKIAEEYEVQNLNRMLRQDVITAILKQAAIKGEGLYCDGFLEIMEDGFGFLRDIKNNYKASSYDIYISQNQIKRFGFRQGDHIGAYIKPPRRVNDRYFSVARLETINGKKLDEIKNKVNFDNLTPLYPTEKLKFDRMNNPNEAISTRVIDLIAPIGKGQRALIVAPPRAGKTLLMKAIAHAINENHPEVELIVLLIDERPEEVTDMQRSVKGEVVSSTFDEPAKRHVELAEIVIEKARRMVEDGKDVIILLDSITRLARAYNAISPSSGKVLTGGVDSNALQRPKRFFGTARNIENGGSLTIIATALIETGSKMDEVIFEEFKGTGNAEIVLDRKIADKRLFPAIDILKSGTRKEEEMVSKEDLQRMWILRRVLIQMAGANSVGSNTSEALEFLIDKLKKSKDNQDFFSKMNGPKSL